MLSTYLFNYFIHAMNCLQGSFLKMWQTCVRFCNQLRRRWREGQPISRMPIDENPDLRYCLLHQQLQLINCCIARRKRRAADLAALEAMSEYESQEGNSPKSSESVKLPSTETPVLLYAKIKSGEKILRIGADRPAADLLMLETGEPVYSPITQV